ncbi:TonB-dependent receptor [Fodinibius sp. Rm-B-1B1-1]|uniref:SusC/RagA family TonB-linked outer membrane protein n=1 Tax=Fodinibius alkaliphilus TaxID=3140241 RepID=UPI00315AFF79
MKIKATVMLMLSAFLIYGLTSEAQAQEREISGTVTSASSGEPLPGVTILVQGSQGIGTATNAQGNYSLDVPEQYDVLVFSYVGFVSQEITIGDQTEINVQLQEDVQQLEDVVVVGYGSRIKEEVTGNISSVSSEEISQMPVNSVESTIQGQAAGVFVNSSNGKLGQGIQMQIRGSSSISASSEPLYVIDGVPMVTSNESFNGAPTNPLADLNYNDIESIDILKDASAAAIYGSRASNGVVIITTKSGQSGQTEFTLNYQTGFSNPTRTRDWLNAEEYVELFTEAAANYPGGDLSGAYIEGQFDSFSSGTDWRNGEVNSDWQSEAFQDASINKFDLSASGGNEKTTFYVSGSYSDEEGILIRNSFERISGRLNLDHNVNDNLRLGTNLSLTRSINNRVSNDNGFATPIQLVALPPITPIYEPAEDALPNYQPTDQLNTNTLYFNNLLYKDNAKYQVTNFRNVGNAYAEYDVIDNLVWRSEFGIDLLELNGEEYYNSQVSRNTGAPLGLGYNRFVRRGNYNTNHYLTFNASVAENHNLEAIGGFEYQYTQRDETWVQGENFPNDDFQQVSDAALLTGGTATETAYSFLSYFSRANYDYNGKYLLTISARVDGSSRFSDENRYGFFPAASAGWVLSDEDFLTNFETISFLKLRASYGITGNAEIGNFPSQGLFGSSTYSRISGIQPTQIENQDLKWEQTAQLDFGVDFGLFEDRITGEVDYYIKNTEDLLLNVNVPGATGYEVQTRNLGKLENKGFELVLNSVNSVGEFAWNTSFNFSINRNKVTDIDGQVIEGGYINRAVEGEAIGVFFARKFAGANPANGDAIYFLNREPTQAELNNGTVFQVNEMHGDRYVTNSFNSAERVVIGNPNPDFTGGLSNRFQYKGFDLNVLFQFVYGNDIYNGGGRFQSASADYFDNQTKDQYTDRWQEPGDITDVPQARLFGANGTGDSSRYLSDGSYLRLKKVTFGYNLPASTLETIGLSKARVYVSGVNLLTFTDYEGWDPEVNTDYLSGGNLSLGNDFYSAPQARTITLGLNVGF